MKIFATTFFAFVSFISISQQTWNGGVGKLFQQNCVQCHRQGGVAPFSLETYQDVLPFTSIIQSSVSSGEMPPWTPDHNYTSFAHQRVLSPGDKSSILDWINNGAPEGTGTHAPSVATFSTGTQLGTPDLSLTIPTYTIGSNTDVYHNFELTSGLPQAMYANAIEILPGNSEAVHHVLVFQDSTNNPIDPNSMGGTGSSASKLIYGYTPGSQPYFAPGGTGFRLPANTRIILQIHYAPGVQGQSDATTVNFKLTSGPQREISVDPVLNHNNITNGPLFIPANQTATFNQEYQVFGNFTLLYTFPHMHLIGKSIKSWANLPFTNDTVRFIDIPEWDFHWQDNFIFPNAIPIPSGSTLRSEALYDNTTNNPENPSSPPQDVSVGEGTYDEMMFVFFAYLPYQTGDEYIIVDDRVIPKGATTICDDETVLLTAIEGVGYTYQWYRDGNLINGANASTYEASLSGDYSVEISLGPNTSMSDPVTVTVNPIPVVSINPPSSTHIPNGGSIQLDATNNANYTYQWYHNGQPINGATSSSYTAMDFGDYYVTATNGCTSYSDTVTLTAEASIKEYAASKGIILFPNPSDDVLKILVKQGNVSTYRIVDLTGKLYQEGNLDPILTEIDIRDLNSGLYLVQIFSSGDNVETVLKFSKK